MLDQLEAVEKIRQDLLRLQNYAKACGLDTLAEDLEAPLIQCRIHEHERDEIGPQLARRNVV